jgi:hypothetical protein
MSLPGFTADVSLPKPIGFYAVRNVGTAAGDKPVVELQQIGLSPLASSMSITPPAGAPGCIDIHYVPRCYSANPLTPIGGQCCDFTFEKRCDGRRVSICTFTECTAPLDQRISS